ncbi:MAG: FAA hydrolase family protein [Betaproteobacteria bacterium]|nr:FAA hydrolase family protein [Betaproteobacteria bacterium]NBT74810.1 FAA hydrolase family protein [Betaproteobacteria bacterium]NBY13630.1 FAA hydrolase family protein [Betaproteobacteria bacterium]NCA15859.1 FAA hydrolase family protein [Betaproteobacteria bacterium]
MNLPIVTPTTLPIHHATDRFAVRRVYCVGRNYADHAIEMGDTGREPPFFFMKPADALFEVAEGVEAQWPYPVATEDCHHEVELVVALGKGGSNLSLDEARSAIWGYALGLDMTRRDRQAEMKKGSKPWEIGKAFDHGAPIGPLVSIAQTGELTQGEVSLKVNGQTRQKGDLRQLIWSTNEVICELSKAWRLAPGDLIYTGTPAGVAAISRGDVLEASAPNLPGLRLRVV